MPFKQKDLGCLTIPCTIKDITPKKVLIHSGASVSQISLSIYQKLGIEKVSDKRMSLEFPDHSTKHSYGVVKDVLLTIEIFRFLGDFVIMDMPEDEETPLILGRPFLFTS